MVNEKIEISKEEYDKMSVEVVIDGETVWTGLIDECPYLEHPDKHTIN